MAAAMYALALELVAFFGFLCLLLNILLPVLAFVLRFVVVDVPREWRKWQLHRYQQRELRRLQRRVDSLTRLKQADEQETRRRARTMSAQKRQQEAMPQHTGEESANLHSEYAAFNAANGSKDGATATPQQQRHRISIYSTAKKPAASSTRERRRAS